MMKPTRFLALLGLFASIAALALSAYQRQLWTRLEPFNGTEAEAFQRGRWLGAKEAIEAMREQTNFSPAIAASMKGVRRMSPTALNPDGDSPAPCGARGDWGGIFSTLPTLSYQRDGVCRTAPGEQGCRTGVTLSDAENLR